MSENLSEALKTLGLSDAQTGRLAALQEAGRKIDFVYHYADDGSDPRRAAHQFDEFHRQLKALSEEGDVPRKFAAALWDHLTPRFVGWRPDFIEGVEARELGGVLTQMDQDIDARLGRAIPPELHFASQEVRTRFDDLLFAYEAGTWRDTRTPGEVRDELIFVAGLDEKIRNVLYGNTHTIDLRSTIENYHPLRGAGDRYQSDSTFEARAYEAQLAAVSDILDRLRTAGIEVHSGLAIKTRSEMPQAFAEGLAEDPVRARQGRSFEREQRGTASPPAADENQYWRGVAHTASTNTSVGRSESLVQSARHGRSL
jgi:hypothetical protein